MCPMRSTQYFQPMVTAPLGKIENFRYLRSSSRGQVAILKPAGLDVFIYNGRMFDFFNREITNPNIINARFKEVLETSSRISGCFLAVMSKKGVTIESLFPLIYDSRGVIENLELYVYDVTFPHFKTEEMKYYTRYDICESLLKKDKIVGCHVLTHYPIKKSSDLNELVLHNFVYPNTQSVLLYDLEGRYMPGLAQLAHKSEDKVLFELKANNRCRGHIHKITPIKVKTDSEEISVANTIVTRFKGELIEVPILKSLDVRSSLWAYRKTLKNTAFWFNCVFVRQEHDEQDIINIHYDRIIL